MEASLALCLLLLQIGMCGLVKKANIRVQKFEQCPDKLNMPNLFKNTYISQTGYNKFRVFGDIIVRLDIVKPANLKCVMSKCPSRQEQDLCEYVFTYKTDKFCEQLDDSKAIWRTFWTQTDMPRRCPISVGNYSLNGAPISIGDQLDMSLFKGYWKSRCTGKTNGKVWFCAISDFDISFSDSGAKGSHKPSKKSVMLKGIS